MLLLFIIIPLVSALILAVFSRFNRLAADIFSAAVTLALGVLSFIALQVVQTSSFLSLNIGGWPAPLGIPLTCDGLSVFFLVAINCLAFLVSMFSAGCIEKLPNRGRYYFFFMMLMAGLNGVLLAGDLFNAFVFIELASISAYILASFGQKAENFEASFKYAVMGSVASMLILFSIALLYAKTSVLSYYALSQSLQTADHSALVNLVTALFIVGFGLKAALVPFHSWAPDAYSSAPSPISAMYAGAVGKALGIYMAIRILFNVIGITPLILHLIASLGVFSIVLGVTLALYQWDFKRLLAYHSISQIGYIMLGIGLGTPLGMFGGLFHLINHTVFKSLLFLNAGSVEHTTGKRSLKDMGGLSKKLPVTSTTSMVASLSISGIPPFNGFWSKLLIIMACISVHNYWFALLAVLGSILTLASFLKVQRYAFYGYLKDTFSEIKESPLSMTIPMIILAILCVFMGCLLLPGVDSGFLGLALTALTNGKEHFAMLAGINR